jgi:hypothetical protein
MRRLQQFPNTLSIILTIRSAQLNRSRNALVGSWAGRCALRSGRRSRGLGLLFSLAMHLNKILHTLLDLHTQSRHLETFFLNAEYIQEDVLCVIKAWSASRLCAVGMNDTSPISPPSSRDKMAPRSCARGASEVLGLFRHRDKVEFAPCVIQLLCAALFAVCNHELLFDFFKLSLDVRQRFLWNRSTPENLRDGHC